MPTSRRQLQTIVSGEEASLSVHSSDLEIMFGASSVESSSVDEETSSGEDSSSDDLEESVASDLTIGALRRKLRGIDSQATNLSSVAEFAASEEESEWTEEEDEEEYYDESTYYDEESNFDTIGQSDLESKDTFTTRSYHQHGSSRNRTIPRRTRRSVRRGPSSVRSATDPNKGGKAYTVVSRRQNHPTDNRRAPLSDEDDEDEEDCDEDEDETIVELEESESAEDVFTFEPRRSQPQRHQYAARKASMKETVAPAEWDDTDMSSKISTKDRRQQISSHSNGARRRPVREGQGRLRHVKYVPAMDIATRSLHRDISTVEPLSPHEASDAFFREVPVTIRATNNNNGVHDDDVSSIGGFASVQPVSAAAAARAAAEEEEEEAATSNYEKVPRKKPFTANQDKKRASCHTKEVKQRQERRRHSHHQHEKETKVQTKKDSRRHSERSSHRHREGVHYEAIKVLARVEQHIDDNCVQEKQRQEEEEETIVDEEDVWIDEESVISVGHRIGYEKPMQQQRQDHHRPYYNPTRIVKKEPNAEIVVRKEDDDDSSPNGGSCCGFLRRRSQMELFFIAIISFSVIALIILIAIVMGNN